MLVISKLELVTEKSECENLLKALGLLPTSNLGFIPGGGLAVVSSNGSLLFPSGFQAFDGDGIPEGIVLHHANWIAQISKLDQNWFGKCQSDQIALRIGAPSTKIRNYATDSGDELAMITVIEVTKMVSIVFSMFFRDCQNQEIQRRNWCIKPVRSLVIFFGWTLLKADARCLPIYWYIGFLKLQQAVFDTGNEVCHVLLTFSITLTKRQGNYISHVRVIIYQSKDQTSETSGRNLNWRKSNSVSKSWELPSYNNLRNCARLWRRSSEKLPV